MPYFNVSRQKITHFNALGQKVTYLKIEDRERGNALHRLYGVALYVMVWHSLAWFGCIDRIYIHTAAEIHVLGCLLEERFPCFTNQN